MTKSDSTTSLGKPSVADANNKRPIAQPPNGDDAVASNPFLLEEIFPNPVDIFLATLVSSATGSDTLVAIDTNALLLPYAIGKEDLGALGKTYKLLAAEQRLFLPARAAREFIRHRDRKIAELLKTISDLGSKISVQEGVLSPILEGVGGYEELKKASADMAAGRKAFLKALGSVRDGVQAWRGNDPVTALYAQVFTAENIIEHKNTREDLLSEWQIRQRNRIPPGYKDRAKEDGGIGDFLIWKSLLQIGRDRKKDLVFVTGEEKADWFVRSAGEPVFTRPELLAEYRLASNGKNLHLSSLAGLLGQFGAEASVVDEVRSAEATANSAVRSTRSASPPLLFNLGSGVEPTIGEAIFDYSRDNGRISVASQKGGFNLRFSKASDTKIHLYRSNGVVAIMRLKGATRDTILDMDEYDASSDTYTIGKGEAFGALNNMGEVLIGRIVDIADDTRGATGDAVRFIYRIFQEGTSLSAP